MKHVILIAAALSLSGCSTVGISDIDLSGLGDFRNEKLKGDYPDVADAPEAPTDVRSDDDWDQAAARMLSERETFSVPGGDTPAKSDAEIEREFQKLEDKVHAYKADDPS